MTAIRQHRVCRRVGLNTCEGGWGKGGGGVVVVSSRPIYNREVELFNVSHAFSLITSNKLVLMYSGRLTVPTHLFYTAICVN